MDDCVFCSIANKKAPADFLFENDQVIIIRSIEPKAPVHVLIVPKRHIPSINEVKDAHQSLIGEMFLVARDQARELGVAEAGYKLIFNVGKDGGQVVPHIHLHLLGGKLLGDT